MRLQVTCREEGPGKQGTLRHGERSAQHRCIALLPIRTLVCVQGFAEVFVCFPPQLGFTTAVRILWQQRCSQLWATASPRRAAAARFLLKRLLETKGSHPPLVGRLRCFAR